MLGAYTYTVDAVGNRTRVTETVLPPATVPGNLTTTAITYTYDALYRLVAADQSDGLYYHYSYDAVGNKLSDVTASGTTTYTYDSANRLTLINGVTPYTWDDAGNLIDNGQGVTYTYDAANRLIATNAGQTAYVYNGLGDRLQQIVQGTTTTYTLDLAAGLTQVLAEQSDNTAPITYLYGTSRLAQQTSASTDYFLTDTLGSVRQLADASGEVRLLRRYEPYGRPISSVGTATTRYDFTGEYKDPAGLLYLRARYYSPTRGRFIQRDTWAGDYNVPLSLNRWLYVHANPVNATDPSGRVSCALLPAEDRVNSNCLTTPSIGVPPNISTYSEKLPPLNITFAGVNLPSPLIYEHNKLVPPGTNQSQFIDANDPSAKTWLLDPEAEAKGVTYHSGLCGQGALAVILGITRPNISLNDVVNEFVNNDNLTDYPNYNGAHNLAKLVDSSYPEWDVYYDREAGSNLFTLYTHWEVNSAEGYIKLVRNWLVSGNKYSLATVLINGSTGMLSNSRPGSQFENKGSAEHWITITGVSHQWDRRPPAGYTKSPWKWVRIYNPYDNEAEYYWWPDFESSWTTSGGNVLVLEKSP